MRTSWLVCRFLHWKPISVLPLIQTHRYRQSFFLSALCIHFGPICAYSLDQTQQYQWTLWGQCWAVWPHSSKRQFKEDNLGKWRIFLRKDLLRRGPIQSNWIHLIYYSTFLQATRSPCALIHSAAQWIKTNKNYLKGVIQDRWGTDSIGSSKTIPLTPRLWRVFGHIVVYDQATDRATPARSLQGSDRAHYRA